MVLRIAVGNEDLTTSRFALSPLWELTQALRQLARGRRQRDETVLRPWLLRARNRYRALARETDLGVIDALSPRHFALRVADCAAARAFCREHSLRPEETTPIPGADRFFIHDPDGNRIEVIQWLEPYGRAAQADSLA